MLMCVPPLVKLDAITGIFRSVGCCVAEDRCMPRLFKDETPAQSTQVVGDDLNTAISCIHRRLLPKIPLKGDDWSLAANHNLSHEPSTLYRLSI